VDIILAFSTLLYGSEILNPQTRGRKTTGIIRDETFLVRRDTQFLITKEEILEDLKVEPGDEKLRRCSQTSYDT
jgi:hypothetical protein